MTENEFDPTDRLPMHPIAYDALFTLVGKEMNGSEILRAIRKQTGNINIVTATLYRHLEYLFNDDLIEIVENPSPDKKGRIRKTYKLTPNGKTMLTEETRRRMAMAQALQDTPGFGDLVPTPQASALGGG